MQKYIENVRQLSEERDQLTSQFEEENEKLKSELNELKSIGGKLLINVYISF